MMELLSIRQAARELRVAERTIRQAVRSGELPGFQLGERTVRVNRSDLEQWVRAKKVRPWTPESH